MLSYQRLLHPTLRHTMLAPCQRCSDGGVTQPGRRGARHPAAVSPPLDALHRHYDRCADFYETHTIREEALAFIRDANTRELER